MPSYQYRKSQGGDRMILWTCYNTKGFSLLPWHPCILNGGTVQVFTSLYTHSIHHYNYQVLHFWPRAMTDIDYVGDQLYKGMLVCYCNHPLTKLSRSSNQNTSQKCTHFPCTFHTQWSRINFWLQSQLVAKPIVGSDAYPPPPPPPHTHTHTHKHLHLACLQDIYVVTVHRPPNKKNLTKSN